MGDIYGSVQNVFEIAQLTAPSGGFFPGRLGVEVTSAVDLAPSYRISALVVSMAVWLKHGVPGLDYRNGHSMNI